MSLGREAAVDRLRDIVETVATERTAVPVREVWAYGDVVLGLDPVQRLDVYVTKDLLFKDAPDEVPLASPAGPSTHRHAARGSSSCV